MENKKKIFYGLVSILILIVAVIGATFAYFTASQSNNAVITGNMASITFNLTVQKVTTVDDAKGGMIPMSNSMVEAAVRSTDDASQAVDLNENSGATCVDDNGNAVCQVYKITVKNTGTAAVYLDGYVDLTGGSGQPTDNTGAKTTMRWAEAFCTTDATSTSDVSGCSTIGHSKTGATPSVSTVTGINSDWGSIVMVPQDADHPNDLVAASGFNSTNLSSGMTYDAIVKKGKFSGDTEYDIINRNYIRLSGHNAAKAYTRSGDFASALVFNQFLSPANSAGDEISYYVVVWLSETGTNQTPGAKNGEEPLTDVPASADDFFKGTVSFISAQGSEVTATFSGYTAVAPTDNNAAQ